MWLPYTYMYDMCFLLLSLEKNLATYSLWKNSFMVIMFISVSGGGDLPFPPIIYEIFIVFL
jgi:hypothetical protein